MATAKKLPSGSWRAQVYSHTENATDEDGNFLYNEKGELKKKRIYESFTCDDPSPAGKRKAERLAAEFADSKDTNKKNDKVQSKDSDIEKKTLRALIDMYVEESSNVLSDTTIAGYVTIKENAFQDLLDTESSKITNGLLKSAVNTEAKRISSRTNKVISAKTVANEYGLITAVINQYCPNISCEVRLPSKEKKIKILPEPQEIIDAIRGTDVELAALIAMWLSFSKSEVRGLTRDSITRDGKYIAINEVVVRVNRKDIRKKIAKNPTRTRMHKIPDYIKKLIDDLPPNQHNLVTLSGYNIYKHFTLLIKKNNLPHMTFHDLRHMNASVMAMLDIPDKYAQERGGWKTDRVMKEVYTHTFSKPRQAVDIKIDKYFNSLVGKHNKERISLDKTPNTSEKELTYKVINNFEYNNLLTLGYFVHPWEGGFLSPNSSTIVYNNKNEHNGEIAPFKTCDIEKHMENIEKLQELGWITK